MTFSYYLNEGNLIEFSVQISGSPTGAVKVAVSIDVERIDGRNRFEQVMIRQA